MSCGADNKDRGSSWRFGWQGGALSGEALCRLASATPLWVLYFCLGVFVWWAGYSHGRLSYDEIEYYLPAVREFAQRAPAFPVADYHLHLPPLGLIVQGSFSRVISDSPQLLRLLSFACSLLAAASLQRAVGSLGNRFQVGSFLFLFMCFPFYLWYSFLAKHHALTVAFLICGYAAWQQYAAFGRDRYLVLCAAYFTSAAATNQLAVLLPGALVAVGLWRQRNGPLWITVKRAAAGSLPLALLLALWCVWGGPQPPSFRGQLLESEVGRPALRLGQYVALLLMLGVWVFPAVRWSQNLLRRAVLFLIPSGLLVHWSGVYAPGQGFFQSLLGPISSAIRKLSGGNYPLTLALAAVPVACGAALAAGWREPRRNAAFYVYLALWLATTDALHVREPPRLPRAPGLPPIGPGNRAGRG